MAARWAKRTALQFHLELAICLAVRLFLLAGYVVVLDMQAALEHFMAQQLQLVCI
jgi:hypothetical protein